MIYFERKMPINYEVLKKGVIQSLLELRVIDNKVYMPNKRLDAPIYRKVKDCLVACGGKYKLGFECWEFEDANAIVNDIKTDILNLKNETTKS